MESYTRNLFKEICRRGCVIEIQKKIDTYLFVPNECHTSHLPNCLISVSDEKPIFKFTINSIISGGKPVCFTVYYNDTRIVYRAEISVNHHFRNFYFTSDDDWKDDMVNLNILTHYVHAYNDAFDLYAQPTQDVLDKYKIILKNKMIHNLTELYLQKFIYLTRANYILSIVEIKITIVETLVKLDKWVD